MHRYAIEYLREWKTRESRRPLIVRGARQVGKSYLVREFGQNEFENYIEIDFEADLDAPSLFRSRSPVEILDLLRLRFEVDVHPGKTLLFLDEIQAAPEVLSTLRYFHEQMPELHIIAAGSLLDFALAESKSSMPVGRIEFLFLGPMTFEEFLLASGRERLVSAVENYAPEDEIPDAIHTELLRLVNQYVVVGGMPASVEAFSRSGTYKESAILEQSILSTYRDDFSKYRSRVDIRRVEKVFARAPLMVGNKFMYSRVDRDDSSRNLKGALQLLCQARVLHRVHHSASNGIPLGAEVDDRVFKVLFMDVGLLCRSLGLSALDIEDATDVLLVNSGAIAEQFIGQHLLHSGEPFEDPTLYYWMREKSQSSAEVDYVVSVGTSIVPIEVKAGKTGKLKSMHVFLEEKDRAIGVRFNTDRPSQVDAETSIGGRKGKPFRLLSLPIYMVGQVRRLLRRL